MELDKLFRQNAVSKQPPQGDPNSTTAKYIKDNEGYNPNIYKDTKNIPTSGYGFNMNAEHIKSLIPKDVLSGKRALSQEESNGIFEKAYYQAVADAKTFVTPEVFETLSDTQKRAIIDMSYNMGLTSINKFDRLRKALFVGDKEAASREVLDSDYARELPARATRNATLMLK